MGSVLRPVRERKKVRRLGEVTVVRREEYADLELDAKVELIRGLVPLGLMHVHELLDEEVQALAGGWHERKVESQVGRRHGSNPGSVRMAGQRVPIRVPRVRSARGEIALRSYGALSGGGEVEEGLLRRVLYGISCRNYETAAEAIPGAIGLSSSTVSRKFIQASAEKLRELQERDLTGEDVVALVLDGGKGLRAAVRKAFRERALVQRCQWHKRENVVSYLAKGEQASWRKRLQRAYDRPNHAEAAHALQPLHAELEERNQSAAGSLSEGLEETLTLHRLGVYGVLEISFKTTNCLESVNALIEERCAKVDCWKNSNQRLRWLATALVDIEPRLRRVRGHRHLDRLREALRRELKIEGKKSAKKIA